MCGVPVTVGGVSSPARAHRLSAVLAVVLTVSATVTTISQGTQEGPVWFWFATCGGPLMTLEVQLDNRIVQKATFPLCRSNRASIQSQGQAGRMEFTFRPGRAIVWKGYRETTDRTAANEMLEGNIWEAGAEPDALILGVSFVNGDRVLMNSVHIAHPAARDESAVATGLVIRTYPAAK
jgi:hypothetical protein